MTAARIGDPARRPPTTAGDSPRATSSEVARGVDSLLGRAIFRREWRVESLAAALAIAVAGAALGRMVAARGLLPDPSAASMVPIAGIASLKDFALWGISRLLPLPIAVATVVAAVDRLAGDGEAPWLATLAAAGLRRGLYVVVVAAAVASSRLALYAALTVGYAAGAASGGGNGAALAGELARGAPGVAALIASCTLYGAACVALARRRAPALVLALAGVVGPLAAIGWLGDSAARPVGSTVVQLLTIAMPPPGWATSANVVLRHAIYCVVLLALLWRSAPDWVARHG